MPPMMEIPLDLPEIRIVKTEIGEREIVIMVESTREWAISCPVRRRDARVPRLRSGLLRLHHLPILGRPVTIEIRPKRFRCLTSDDHPTSTQHLDWYDERSPHTKAYDQWLLLALIGSTITDVARKEGATYDAVLGALRRQIAAEVNWAEVAQMEVLGIDEIALKKGHRDFVVLLTTRQADGQVQLLGVLPDRRLETVAGFLRAIPERLQATVREVCTDMYEGFTSAVKQAMPRARGVVDRFHVVKAYRGGADKLRKEVQRELKAGLSKEEYEGSKGTMWLFRRDPQGLDQEERGRLALLFECAPELKRAYDLRERLTAVRQVALHHAPHVKCGRLVTGATEKWRLW